MSAELTEPARHWHALAKLVKERRLELGIMTQRAAAEAAGVHTNTWNKIENAQPVKAASLSQIALVLRWHPSYVTAILREGEHAPKHVLAGNVPARGHIPGGLPAFTASMQGTVGTQDEALQEVEDARRQLNESGSVADAIEVAKRSGQTAMPEYPQHAMPTYPPNATPPHPDAAPYVEKHPEGFRVAEVGGTSYVFPTSTARTGRSRPPAQPRAGRFTEVPPTQPEQEQRQDPGYPALVPITEDIRLMVVPISMAAEVADELSHEDLRFLFEHLRGQGIEMAKGIARARRAERARQGFESQSEWPPIIAGHDENEGDT